MLAVVHHFWFRQFIAASLNTHSWSKGFNSIVRRTPQTKSSILSVLCISFFALGLTTLPSSVITRFSSEQDASQDTIQTSTVPSSCHLELFQRPLT